MNKPYRAFAWFALMLIGSAFAQSHDTKDKSKPKADQLPTLTTVLDRQLTALEREFVPAAEAMPDDKFSFAPTNGEFKGVRTFGQQVRHVGAANYAMAAAILQEKPPADIGKGDGPESMTSKADSIKYLKDSFDYAHKAIAAVNEKNATEPIQSPFGPGKTTLLSMSVSFVGHSSDHYGQMVEYLRMNGIIPPASRQQ